MKISPPGSPGAFGAVRKHDRHTGIDLYCEAGTEVRAFETGRFTAVVEFTGPLTDPPSPWWNPTQAVLVESLDHILCYGEIDPWVATGDNIELGQVLGTVLQVLKENKGRPVSMLHFEMYTLGTTSPVWWQLEGKKPPGLLDPTDFVSGLRCL